MQNSSKPFLNGIIKKVPLRDILIVIIILAAILTRTIGLGDRVMSHDEVNHVVPAFDLFAGQGYRHDPVTHGPLQFHLMGLSYFLFGDNDFTSRLPHAMFGVLTIAIVMLYFKEYLGNIGSIITGILFTISPFMLFYSRYARNDIICVFLDIAAIYAVLKYYKSPDKKYLFYLTVALALNFTAKETAYIFAAQLLLFVVSLFAYDLIHTKWQVRRQVNKIVMFNVLFIISILLTLAASVLLFRNAYLSVQGTSLPMIANLGGGLQEYLSTAIPLLQFALPGLVPLVVLVLACLFLRKYLRWDLFSPSRSFSLLILLGSIVLPLLAPFLVRFAGMDPSAYSDPYVVLTDYVFISVFFFISFIVGSAWDKENWWKYAAIFYAIYAILYSSFFTNTAGLMTGMVGSLGHWLNQQSVQRGGQPVYYYAFILLPIYEFLSIAGTAAAFYFGIKHHSFWKQSNPETEDTESHHDDETGHLIGEQTENIIELPKATLIPFPAIFIFFIFTSLIAYTIAGEKMPWLTLHIVFPMLLTSGWAFDQIYKKFIQSNKPRNTIYHLTVFGLLINSIIIFIKLAGNHPPFQSQTQVDLQASYAFIFYLLIEVGLLIYLVQNRQKWISHNIRNSLTAGLVILFAVITARSGYQASFINYDNAKEFLVYAHASEGPKLIMEQVEEISKRTTNGLEINVAYDNHGLYPFWWYMRHYPNRVVYLENPTRSLEDSPIIIAGQDKYAKLEPIVRENYYAYEYTRLWWPMQDYWNLSLDKVVSAITNKNMRQALFNIWFNRDYSLYADVKKNQSLTLERWSPSEKMRMYIRKDIAAQMWQYASDESFVQEITVNPYAENMASRTPDGFIGMSGSNPGELNAPRGIDIASDGSIYVADSRNNRIQVFSADGILQNVWGTYANVTEGEAPGGTFNEPWDVAVGLDGSIYVADTFNHRIQKFDASGRFVKMWGVFAQGKDPQSFWGPRGIDIDQAGRVYITDTGNKRVLVFDADLNFITQFGGGGYESGQFDEPVGIAINSTGEVIVADTWNRRVQVFTLGESQNTYSQRLSFDIDGWFGQGIDNKPYLTTDEDNNIYVSDPEGGRVLVFDREGNYMKGYQDMNISADLIGYPFGLAVDNEGLLWFSDAATNVISYISLSTESEN